LQLLYTTVVGPSGPRRPASHHLEGSALELLRVGDIRRSILASIPWKVRKSRLPLASRQAFQAYISRPPRVFVALSFCVPTLSALFLPRSHCHVGPESEVPSPLKSDQDKYKIETS
jgi:hypothetical protein